MILKNTLDPSHAYASLPMVRPAEIGARLLFMTMLLFPLHTQIIYMMIPRYAGISADIVSLWKEIALLMIVAIFMAELFLARQRASFALLDILIAMFAGLMVAYIIAAGRNRIHALYGFRIFAEPFAVFYLAKTMKISFRETNANLKHMFYLAVAISIWAIVQAALLGDGFLMDIGYRSKFGRLYSSFYISMFQFQRAVGTFSSPNMLGIYLQAMIMTGLSLTSGTIRKSASRYYVPMLILLFALVYSFSRSAWFALLVSATVFVVMKTDPKKVVGFVIKSFIITAVAILLVFAAAPDIVETFFVHSSNTFTLRDPSTVGHIGSIFESFDVVLSHPFGIGLGMSGPKALVRAGSMLNAENSFFILAFDVGIPGAVLYSIIMLIMLISLLAMARRTEAPDLRRFRMIVASIFIGQVAAWNFLPFIVELEATVVLFFLAGLGLNRNMEPMQDAV